MKMTFLKPLAIVRMKLVSAFALFLCLSSFVSTNSVAQMIKFSHPKVYSEAEFYYGNGKWYSDRLIVKFKPKVVDLPRGRKTATLSDFATGFTRLKTFFQSLEVKYGKLAWIKRIPSAQWGDTLAIHVRSGQPVPISERSQLFTLKFNRLVPIDSLIQILQGFAEVAYAERSIMTVSFATPNDPKYATQWTLANVRAASAWDITTGSSTIKIAIVDNGTLQNHEDLQSQIVGGDGSSGNPDPLSTAYGHGTSVAGVAAAHTNNSKGVASLSWNVKLLTYDYTLNSHEAAIDSARTHGADGINMSWGLTEPVEPFSCGGRYWTDKVEPGDRVNVMESVQNALAQGIICIAAAGNGSENPGMEGFPQCDPTYPPKVWKPAGYYFTEDKNHNPLNAGVIAVSATHPNDTFRDGWNYDPQQTLPPPATRFMDLAAPGGSDLETTHADGGYRFVNGTSFAAPMVSALAGLMLSINSFLSVQQVESIMEQSADKVGQYAYTNDWNRYMGFGRINAYQALLLTHAYSTKSMSATATASNNGRRLVKTSDGRYHLVFESGITSGGNVLSEIFYRRSNVGGTSWETPIRLSDGNEQNRYPGIAERSGSGLYVVWQRKTGTNTYDILFRHYNGSSWEATQTITGGISVTSDPLPVIAICTPSASFEMMTVYRTGSGLKSRRSTSTNGSSWASEITVTDATNARNASLVYKGDGYAYFDVSWDDGTHVYYRKFFGSSWGNETNVSLNSAANTHEYPSFAVGATNNRHIVWQATDPSQGNRKVILHNLELNPTIYTKFYSSSTNYLRPNISGFQSGGAVVLWHDQSSAKNIRYARFNGSYWEGNPPAGTVYGTNGIDASCAVMNPPSSPIKAIWRSEGSAPYTLTMGTALQKSAEFETIVYSRQLLYLLDDRSVLALRLFTPQISGENVALTFPEISNADSLVAESLAEKLAFDFIVPAKAEEAKLDVELYANEASHLLQSGRSDLQISFELVDIEKNRQVAFATTGSVALSGETQIATTLSLPLTEMRSTKVRIQPVLSGVDINKVRGALVHEYGAYPVESRQSKPPTAQIATNSHDLSMRIHPNPFNPTTTIHFSLPTAGIISLRIYDVNGRLVREWSNEQRRGGEHAIVWDGNDQRGQPMASGMYFTELVFGAERRVAKMALVR